MKIDGIWELEGFTRQSNAVASIKYGLIGLGQGGSKIVDAFAGIRDKNDNPVYKTLIVNSNVGDMKNLKNIPQRLQFGLKGYEQGVGKDPDVGKEAFLKNGQHIFEVISDEMSECEFVYVVSSLGGGTGTGSINVLVDAIADYLGKDVGAIASLPRPDEVESLNAFNALSELVEKLTDVKQDETDRVYRGLENLILLDNEKIIEDHIKDPERQDITWDYYSNYKMASIFHEWNVLTSLEGDITVDAADLRNHVLKTGGVITFAKKKINLDDIKLKDDLIEEIISTYKGKNVLANGFNYETDLQSMALVVVMPKERMDLLNQDTLEILRTRIKKELPDIGFYPGFVNNSSRRHAIVYTMSSLSGLPYRAKNLRSEAEELLKIRKEKEAKASGFNMGDKIKKEQASIQPKKIGSNPFAAAAKEEKTSVIKKATNPFRMS